MIMILGGWCFVYHIAFITSAAKGANVLATAFGIELVCCKGKREQDERADKEVGELHFVTARRCSSMSD